jgi:hypothetical protein
MAFDRITTGLFLYGLHLNMARTRESGSFLEGRFERAGRPELRHPVLDEFIL